MGVEEIEAFASVVSVRLENAYEKSELRRIVNGGVHKVDVDLRDWTGRLLSELRYELDRRGAIVYIPHESLDGTAAAPQPLSGRPTVRFDDTFRTLRVRVTEVSSPDSVSQQAFQVSATVESPDRSFTAGYSAGAEKRGFSDALLELKRRIVRDPDLEKWLTRTGG